MGKIWNYVESVGNFSVFFRLLLLQQLPVLVKVIKIIKKPVNICCFWLRRQRHLSAATGTSAGMLMAFPDFFCLFLTTRTGSSVRMNQFSIGRCSGTFGQRAVTGVLGAVTLLFRVIDLKLMIFAISDRTDPIVTDFRKYCNSGK